MNRGRLQDHLMDLCRDNASRGWHDRLWKRGRPGNDIWLRSPRNGWKRTLNDSVSRPTGQVHATYEPVVQSMCAN